VEFLHRLGALESLRGTGAPLVERTDTRVEDLYLRMALPQRPGDVGAMMSVRRALLDPILAELAAQAGADVRMGAQVGGVIEGRGRVVGVRYTHDGAEHELRARLVVGADGRHSTLARLVGARRYNLTPSQRLLFWAYFEGVDAGVPTFLSHRWGERFILGIPSDSSLYQVLVWPEAYERETFARDRDAAFLEHARTCEPLADLAMRDWGRWREHEFAEHYWLAYDLEEAGTLPPVLVEFLRRLQRRGRAGEFFDALNHRARPSQVLTPPRMLAASTGLLVRPGRARALAQVGALGTREARRRWMGRHPVFAAGGNRDARTGELELAAEEREVGALE
jgi:hypothetical protein